MIPAAAVSAPPLPPPAPATRELAREARPSIPEAFRRLRAACGKPGPAPAPGCLAEADQLERDVGSRLARDAFAKMRLLCELQHDPCEPGEM
jgi:hypothetical protein